MKYNETATGWNPGTDEVYVGTFPVPDRYRFSGGACFAEVKRMEGADLIARLFIDFHTIVVRDGVPVDAAHKAFLVIDEYRRCISPDITGAKS